jgi:hypothetical protein
LGVGRWVCGRVAPGALGVEILGVGCRALGGTDQVLGVGCSGAATTRSPDGVLCRASPDVVLKHP